MDTERRRMSQLALLHPPKILASLHALDCAGPDACSCVPVYVVHEEPAGEVDND